MQGNVGVAAAETCEQRRHEPCKGNKGIPAKGAEQQIEPDHIRLQTVQSPQQADGTTRIIERPAAQDGKPLRLDVVWREFIGQNRKVEERITLQLLCDVKPIFT